MKYARTFSLLAASTLLGTLVISQGLAAQDPPPAPQEVPADEAPATDAQDEASRPATELEAETEADAAPAKPLPPLDLRRIVPVQGDATAGQAKAEVCSACHGPQGIAIAPMFPNLAGQRAEYLYWQLVEYQRGNVPASAMTPLVADLTDVDMRDLAVYYAGLPSRPAPAAEAAPATEEEAPAEAAPAPDPNVLALGQSLYLNGDPAKGIPACQGCHGKDAQGFPDAMTPNRNGHIPYALFPKLRGQQLDYLQTRLGKYQTGEAMDSSADRIMNGVGHRLDAESIAALSQYLSSQ